MFSLARAIACIQGGRTERHVGTTATAGSTLLRSAQRQGNALPVRYQDILSQRHRWVEPQVCSLVLAPGMLRRCNITGSNRAGSPLCFLFLRARQCPDNVRSSRITCASAYLLCKCSSLTALLPLHFVLRNQATLDLQKLVLEQPWKREARARAQQKEWTQGIAHTRI